MPKVTSERRRRGSTLWTKEKIAQVITLYHKHECLWNHYKEAYKIKESRERAINEICKALRITKFEYGKKIHNLRNQFNSEMKKLERRMEESGCQNGDLSTGRCRWEHFESLMFLRDVIAPRPAGFQNGGKQTPQEKKRQIAYDYNSEDDTIRKTKTRKLNEDICDYHFVEATADDHDDIDFRDFGHALVEIPPDDSCETKPAAPTTASGTTQEISLTPPISGSCHKAKILKNSVQKQQQKPPLQQEAIIILNEQHDQAEPLSACSTLATQQCDAKQPSRDQWDAFGDLIANEFRNLNSDVSRKRLKRKIMHAMLEVGEEDDLILPSVSAGNS